MSLKQKKCRHCKAEFTPIKPMQIACSIACAVAMARKKREKVERANDRQKRESMKTARDYIKPAQDAFNAFIRERDKDKHCICCGRMPDSNDWKPGGVWDAGHFLSRGAYPELRFVEDNCHRQLKTCNGGSSKYAKKGRTVSQGYRKGLIARIGLERVEWLEGPHEPKRYTIDDLKAIKAHYIQRTKELRNVVGSN